MLDRYTIRVLVCLTAILLIMGGCGGGADRREAEDQEAGKPVVTQEEVPPGALSEVSAEMGGEGFTGEGWTTYMDYEPSGDPNAKKGGMFAWAIPEFPRTVRILGKDSNSYFNSMLEGLVYESLIGIHSNDIKIVPSLATHWQISEDKQTFRFRINPDARFADGSRITAEDVLASWKLRIDPGIIFPSTNITFGYYEEPVIESPYIISVKTTELNWRLFLYFGGMSILPAKYLNQIDGGQYLKFYQYDMLPGSGAYYLDQKDIVKGRSITVTRRDDYWDKDNPLGAGSANLDRIKFVEVTNERLRFEKFKKGELDLYVVGRAQWWIEETNFSEVKRGLVQKRKIYSDEPQGTSGLVFNMREPPFDDIRVRKAFSHLLNRKKLMEQLFFNEYTYLDSYWPGGIYENPDNPIYRYDPDKAVALLKEAGWSERNREGWLINEKGEPFELDLAFSTGWDRIFTVFQEDLAKVGIKLNLKESTPATLFKMAMERKFTIHWQSWTGLLFPNPETSWASYFADTTYTNNLAAVKNDRIDELLKEYNVTFDQERRIEIIREIDGILMKIQPMALGWYAPFTRVLYWNKFGQPEYYFPRISRNETAIVGYWWYDEEKDKHLQEALEDESIQLQVGPIKVTYWPEYNAEHGRKFKSDF